MAGTKLKPHHVRVLREYAGIGGSPMHVPRTTLGWLYAEGYLEPDGEKAGLPTFRITNKGLAAIASPASVRPTKPSDFGWK